MGEQNNQNNQISESQFKRAVRMATETPHGSLILVLIGEFASGKDKISRELCDKLYFHFAISYTTRKPRENEVDGREYHFVTDEEFEKLLSEGKIIEKTEYNVNGKILKYGLGEKSFVDDKPNVVILNPHGISQLVNNKKYANRMVVAYITADLDIRIERYLNRDKVSDSLKLDLLERIYQDEKDFKDLMGILTKYYKDSSSELLYKPYKVVNNGNIDFNMILVDVLDGIYRSLKKVF